MNPRFHWPMVFLVFLLAGCFGGGEEQKDAASIKSQIGDQSSRIQSIQTDIDDIKAKSNVDDKTLAVLAEYIDLVKTDLQSLSDSQDATKADRTELTSLNEKIEGIAAQVLRLTEQVNTRRAESAPAQPRAAAPAVVREKKKPEPPFVLVGIEYRGQEPFLAVVAKGGKNLSEVKLLQPLDFAAEDWRLRSFDASQATFFVDGQDITIALP
ncbi:MAG: hypothetical protein LBE75_05075 [Burkholderiales bacterium]|jgi:hypothetical protein|nr:hypothetical protein [Burkholderiales bacterium]